MTLIEYLFAYNILKMCDMKEIDFKNISVKYHWIISTNDS